MSALSDNFHMAVVKTIVPGFETLPRELQNVIEDASDAVVESLGSAVRWLFD